MSDQNSMKTPQENMADSQRYFREAYGRISDEDREKFRVAAEKARAYLSQEGPKPKRDLFARLRRRKHNLVCPFCGAGRRNPDPWGGDVSVKRDGRGTRTCRNCSKSWLPADDPRDAGGPYKGDRR